MSIPKKYGNSLNFKTDSDTYQRLIHVSSEAGQTKTVAAERALKVYMDDYDYKQEMLRELRHCDTVMDTTAAEADSPIYCICSHLKEEDRTLQLISLPQSMATGDLLPKELICIRFLTPVSADERERIMTMLEDEYLSL